MKTRNSLRHTAGAQTRTNAQDCKLCWIMRVVGVALAVTALAFMTQDIFTSDVSMWFFGLCAGLGVITAVSSWMPGPARVQLHDRPALRPVAVHPITRRKAA